MTVFSGLSTAWRFAGSPTRIPPFVNPTTDGNILPPYVEPSALGMIFGAPCSIYAASEFVVPRSIPMILGIRISSVSHNDDLRGTQDPVLQPVSFADDLLDGAVRHPGFGDPLDAVMNIGVERGPVGGDLLEAGLGERPEEVVVDHPETLRGVSLDAREGGVEIIEDREQPGDEGLVRDLHESFRVACRPLAEVLEIRLEVLQPFEQVKPLPPGRLEFLLQIRAGRGLPPGRAPGSEARRGEEAPGATGRRPRRPPGPPRGPLRTPRRRPLRRP